MNATSVIFYRSSPSQKAELVKLIKKITKNKKICAIGDGSNDVNMIEIADIGIGIKGNEGLQASIFADFSIPEF